MTATIGLRGDAGTTAAIQVNGTDRVVLDSSGNVNISTTGARITADFSNATLANRVALQTSTLNSPTGVFLIPNGSSQQAQLAVMNSSGLTDGAGMQILVNATESRLHATNYGSGSPLPMTFYTGGSERMRIDTSGGLSVSVASRNSPLTDNDLSFDLTARNNFTCTPTAGGTLTFTNIASATGQSGTILLVNGANYAIAAAATTKKDASFLSTVSTTGTYRISYYCDGTNVYVTTSQALS